MADKQILAGASRITITPGLDVSLCGSMTDRTADVIHDDLHARCLVLDNGETRIALIVLDLIAGGREWIDGIKHRIHGFTQIPMEHILISCTHTHSAVTPVRVFQSNPSKEYLQWAAPRVADAARVATKRLRPARIGWALGKEDRVVFNRRFHMKPGTKLPSPFPGIDDKVKMNPGEENPAVDRPAGPIDPDVAVLAVQHADDLAGAPLALFASYSLHYVGGNPGTDVSADYFGVVANMMHERLGRPHHDSRQPFVPMLANACFGDINNVDVRRKLKQPYPYHQMYAIAETVSRAIHEAWKTIRYHDWLPLLAQQRELELAVRKPSASELREAREILERAPQGPLRLLPDIYARETVQVSELPETHKTIVQALRLGDLAICALPGEPFCQTGLDLKAASPFKQTMMVGMANDYAGYLPTEEAHALGGYETWRAKSSFLEIKAATKAKQAASELLAALARK